MDFGGSVQQTSDGGFIISAITESYGNGSDDVWLIKTDSNGAELWNKTFGGSESDYPSAVQQTIDLGYLIVGGTRSFGNGRIDLWLIKTDSEGIEEWNKTFGGSEYDKGESVQQTSDGGYIIVGMTDSYGNGRDDIWLIKLNGTTLRVPSQYSTIKAAIDAASAGDTVLVADGTYTENLNISKDIKIIGENGAEKTIIDGGKNGEVVWFRGSTTRDCLLDGFTVTNGGNSDPANNGSDGGGIVINGSPTLKNLIIRDNERLEGSGEGISIVGGGNALITDCIIKDNRAHSSSEGVINVYRSSVEFKNCVISNNDGAVMHIGTEDPSTYPANLIMDNVEVMNHSCVGCGNDATISIHNATTTLKNVNIHDNKVGSAVTIWRDGEDAQVELKIEDSDFIRNHASTSGGSGGALRFSNLQLVRILNTTFSSDSSKTDGGAIYSWNTDSLFIDNSTFNGNVSTDGNGGAMTVKGDENSTLYCEIKNTTFENNSGGWGGAIAAFEPIDMNIDSVFATGNEASGNGGFIELCCGASVSITNSTIYNNETNNNDLNVGDSKLTIKNSIIWKDKIGGGGTDATIEVTYSDVEGGFTGTGNIDANPIFCDTINYLIRDTSPCVGTGENGSNMGARGIGCYRPSSFDWVSTALDTINITQSNLADTYTLQWSESTDADGDSIIYLLYARTGVNPAEEVYDTTSTSLLIPYQEFLQKTFEQIPMLSRATVKFSVGATDGFDTVMVMGDDRVVFVNRYEYLSTEGKGIPTEFVLHENYPNPFNPTTILRFDLPEVSNLTLTIYNMLGQKVKTFNMQSTPAGYHSVKWNATNDYGDPVGAGVYLYQLQTKDFVKTRKMVLLK